MMKNSIHNTRAEEIGTEDLPLPTCSIDPKGKFLRCNTMMCELLGYTVNQLLTKSLFDIADLGTGKLLRSALASLIPHAPASIKSWLLRRDGTEFPAMISAIEILGEHNEISINMIVVDDTFNYSAKEKAKRESEDSRRKEQLKNEFIAVASHELRTPIQPILGFALLAKRGKISQEQAWEGVLKEARRLQQLANDILDASRIESNTIAYNMELVRLGDLIKSVIASFVTDLRKELSIIFEPTQQDIEIEADRSRITQVITNLIGNSVKFTASGRVAIKCFIAPGRSSVQIAVSDTGSGIPADVLPKLFGKFVTKGHGEALTNQGTGLGLYICKAIISAHGGTISARNNDDGIGATFIVELPFRQLA